MLETCLSDLRRLIPAVVQGVACLTVGRLLCAFLSDGGGWSGDLFFGLTLPLFAWTAAAVLGGGTRRPLRAAVLLFPVTLAAAYLFGAHAVSMRFTGHPLLASQILLYGTGGGWWGYLQSVDLVSHLAAVGAAAAWTAVLAWGRRPFVRGTRPAHTGPKTASPCWGTIMLAAALPVALPASVLFEGSYRRVVLASPETASVQLALDLGKEARKRVRPENPWPARQPAKVTAKPCNSYDILVMLHDSWSRWAGPGSGLAPRQAALLAEPDRHGVSLTRTFAVSNYTELGLPAFMTGRHPSWTPWRELMTLPTLLSQARACGLRTLWASSSGDFSDMQPVWRDLIDPLAERALSGGPRLNDLFGDDQRAAAKAARWVQGLGPDDRAFVLFYGGALHAPCLETGMDAPGRKRSRCAAAALVADRAAGVLIDAFRKSGRLDRTIVIGTGDQGEDETPSYAFGGVLYGPDGRPPRRHRTASLHEGVAGISAYVSLPEDFPRAARNALGAWQDRAVSAADVGWTLMRLLGEEAPAGGVFSLFEPPPEEPRRLQAWGLVPWRRVFWPSFLEVEGDYRLMWRHDDGLSLSDVAADPMQSRNLLCEMAPRERARWVSRITRWPPAAATEAASEGVRCRPRASPDPA